MNKFEKTLLHHSKWEKQQKQEFQARHQPMQTVISQGNDKGYEFDPFTQDLFSSLYQPKPKFPEDTTLGKTWQKNALDAMKDLKEYKDLRKMGTICDSFQSGLGATIMGRHFADKFPKMETKNPDDLEKRCEMYKELLESGCTPAQAERLQNKLEKTEKEIPVASKAWQDNQPSQQDLRIILRNALTAARDEIEETEANARAFGFGSAPGKDGYTDTAVKMKVAEMIKDNPKLKQIAELAGRMRREARTIQSQKKNPGPDELSDIETGADLERLLPTEMQKLAHPLLKYDFAKNMLERSLMQYRLETPKKETRGPIIICIDGSASMVGEREIWSKAVALALCQIATDQKRAFEIIHFNKTVKRTDKFEAGKVDPLALLDSISYFPGGGTDFTPPLTTAFEHVMYSADKNMKKADVIFITDGIAKMDDRIPALIAKAKKQTGVSLFSICLGTYVKVLKPISDEITHLKDLQEDEALKETIFSI